ncbi:hypothetical protein WJ47_17025 [Burkholderia ubonensis]|uniref:Uncharacterized protein n=1 Tax=Burkholderia ubonensis TaxID=101571 RepID=A0AB73FZV2_9BURK|nr:hypothetical protein WJ44_15130 [Burkholderia ubonensis]KVL61815.1 hypothetical protein WJ47_17025 [Burkholderia ubonensis]KVM28593.1 hypothetical protein WJ53_09015 [Burkholderia ubonensis]KVM35104.1 hypothetical protein WJ54_36005 [Burkholderia ubonensis]
MARSSAKRPPARPAPRHVDAVVFSVAMRSGDVEVIGIPFEHRGRTWAVHGNVGLPLMGDRITPSLICCSAAKCSAAIAKLDAVPDEKWADAFGADQAAQAAAARPMMANRPQ